MNSKRGLQNSSNSREDLAQNLEEKARGIVTTPGNKAWDSSPSSILEREIAFVLGKIDRTHTLHENLERSLTRSECSIGSDLMNLTPHDSGYTSYQIDSREKLLNRKLHERLRTRMQRIEEERRRLAQTKAEKLHALQSELLDLMERHQLFSNENPN